MQQVTVLRVEGFAYTPRIPPLRPEHRILPLQLVLHSTGDEMMQQSYRLSASTASVQLSWAANAISFCFILCLTVSGVEPDVTHAMLTSRLNRDIRLDPGLKQNCCSTKP